ncbi:MAG: ATP-binding cassette domain-containing protein [Desulfobacterales bacterium]
MICPKYPCPHPAPLIHITNLSKTYAMGGRSLDVLDALTFSVHAGDFIAVMEPSGSGKSTLLNILGCLDRATAGTYLLEGIDISLASDDWLSKSRPHIRFRVPEFPSHRQPECA